MDQHAVLAGTLLRIPDVRLMVRCPGPAENQPTGKAEAARDVSDSVSQDRRGGRPPLVPRSWRRWVVAAVALLMAGMIAIAPHRPAGRPDTAITAGPSVAGAPPKLVLSRGFAVVIQLAAAEWEPGEGQRPSEGDLLAAGRLVLRSGRVTLGLLSGVTLTLEGPADLELLSIDRVHCRRGKLRTCVPHGAEGFIVTTPGSAVVDLGTEFALNVAVDGKADVMVFNGQAEAAVLNAAGAPKRSQQVMARHAFAIDPGRGQIEAAEAHARWISSRRQSWPPPAGARRLLPTGDHGRRPMGLLEVRGDQRRLGR